ncbi:MAG TPA: hypothetical protein VEU30_14335, partial [Thermoanaerobaculia bacterium]|nr:hypothetical protein [Thermoanaerobaculia bacterium]
MPASPWEFDEPLFFQALEKYDPLMHHPPPPGYPVFIHAAQAVRLLVPSDFATLVAISILASLIGFALFALAFRNLTGELSTGIAGAMFFYWSPALLIHSTLPISEAGALALLAASLYFATTDRVWVDDRRVMLFAGFAALTVGWRIQYSIFIVPYFLVATAMLKTWRDRLIALATFTVVCLLWLTPLITAVGGVDRLVAYEVGQGKVLAAHDADESRTGWTPARIAFRFIGRGWGAETMALPVLGLAAYGFFLMIRRRAVIPLLAGAAVYIAVALWVMDPADGVRYAIPFTLAVAFFAGAGSRKWPYAIPVAAGLVFAMYTSTLLVQRRMLPSPPVRAAEFIKTQTPKNAVVLYELPLWPHASYFLKDRNPHRVDDGLAKFWNRPDVPLFIYADGATVRKDAQVFEWAKSDAYLKLTRNHYRATSVIPVPPERRFRIVEGVYAPERDQDGREWRWLTTTSVIQVPDGPARPLALRIGLPQASAIE